MEQVAKAIAGRKCVLFAGAGASRDAGLPDWLDMARRLKDSLVEQAKLPTQYEKLVTPLLETNDNLPLVLEIILGVVPRKDVAKALRTILTPSKESKVNDIIGKLGLHGAVTTNYDRVLDSAFPSNTYRLTNSLDKLKLVPTAVGTGHFVLKLHGDIDDELAPSDPQVARGAPFMVLSTSDYAALVQGERGQSLMLALHSILQENSVLFIGYSFSDPDINWLLQYLAVYCQFAHTSWYIGLRGESLPQLPQNVLGIPALDAWDDLPGWLADLSEAVRRQRGAEPDQKPPTFPPPPSDEQRRALVAVGQYLQDLQSDDLAERVLACAVLDDIAAAPELSEQWLTERISGLLDVGPGFAAALAAATARYLGRLSIVDALPDGRLTKNESAVKTLRRRAAAEWNANRDRFYASVDRRLGDGAAPLPPAFKERLDNVLQDLCINCGEGMARWLHRGLGEDFGWQHAQHLVATYLDDREDIRKADAVLRLVCENPSEDEIPYLYRLLGGAFLANSVRLEPSASRVLKSALSSYELYLDSNILLPLLIAEHQDHKTISAIVDDTLNAGAKVFVLQELFGEVDAHREIANWIVRDCEENVAKLVTSVEVLGKRANCFVQGYLNALTPDELTDAAANVRNATVTWNDYAGMYTYDKLRDILARLGITIVTADHGGTTDPEYRQVLKLIENEWRRKGVERPSVLNENEAHLFVHIYRRRAELAEEGRVGEVWFLSYETVLERVFQRHSAKWGMPPTFPFSVWVAFLDARLIQVHKDPGAIVRAILIGYSSASDLPDLVAVVRKKAFRDRVPTSVEEEALQFAASGFQTIREFEQARNAILARSNLGAATSQSAKAMVIATGEISATLAHDIQRLREQLEKQQARADEAEAKLRQRQSDTIEPTKPLPQSGASAPAQRQPVRRKPRPSRRRRR